jgi:hypothetical protein
MRLSKIALRGMVIALLSACLAAAADPAGHFNPNYAVVFPAEKAASLVGQCSRAFPKIHGTWTPTSAQIAAFEAVLEPALRKRLADLGSNSPSDYYRQYGGVIVSGTRFIYANGFHRSHVESTREWLRQRHNEGELSSFPKPFRGDDYWKGVHVDVCDGGDEFWAAAFDVRAGRLMRFSSEPGSEIDIQFNGLGWDRPRRPFELQHIARRTGHRF